MKNVDGILMRVIMATLYGFSQIYAQLVNFKLFGYRVGCLKGKSSTVLSSAWEM